jgi:hypothetical protein
VLTVYIVRQGCMRRCLLVFLSVLPLLVTGCKKGEGNLTQSTPSQTPVTQATPTPPPDTNRTAKFIVLLYHRFEDRPAELVTTPNDFRAQMKVLKKVTFCRYYRFAICAEVRRTRDTNLPLWRS